MNPYLSESVPAPITLGAFMGIGLGLVLLAFAFGLIMLVSFWKIFTKAGKPGWASIIPVYNSVVLAQIAKQPWWYGLLMSCSFLSAVPKLGIVFSLIAFVFYLIIVYKLALAFGQKTGFAIGLILLPIVFFPILAFNKNYQYQKEAKDTAPPTNSS
ncbi:MAG: hypothetical protein QG648_173 [Patescibacteria group bacterium]|nr:hypothetical protein [Patescibacteria group bacterium]